MISLIKKLIILEDDHLDKETCHFWTMASLIKQNLSFLLMSSMIKKNISFFKRETSLIKKSCVGLLYTSRGHMFK